MQMLLQDLRYAGRMLVKRPGFAIVAIFTLALGIGANSAIFSVVNAVLLRPLPFKEPEQLIKLWESFPSGFGSVSYQNLLDWRENTAFTGLAAFQTAGYSLQTGDTERIPAAMVSANFFDVLAVQPQLGRGFTLGEDEIGRNRVVILSQGLWQRRFGADSSIVGKSILLSGEKFEVVGVMSPDFRYPSRLTELWVPLDLTEAQRSNRGNHFLLTLGRLKPGATIDQAREQLVTIARRLESQSKDQAGRSVRLIPLQEEVVQYVRPALLMLCAAVGFVLLIGCINVANLLLARAAGRRREIAIRIAVGAGRWRLIRQFLTESVLLSVTGGAFGLLLAKWGVSGIVLLAGSVLPRATEIGLDGRVVAFTLVLSLFTGIAFGLAPAWQNSKGEVQTALKDSGNAGASPQPNQLRGYLVIAEVAAAMVLLIGAGLLLKSFWRLQRMDAGLQPDNVLTMSLSLPPAKYATSEATNEFHNQLLQRVAALPGVQAAGMINFLPLQQWGVNGDVTFEGEGPYQPGRLPYAEFRTVSSDYFHTLGIPLVAGRLLSERDRANAPLVALVNEALVRRYLPGKDPVGRRLSWDGQPATTIVGVVGDVHQSGLTQAAQPEIYFPYQQAAESVKRNMSLVVRASGNPTELVPAIRNEVRGVDKDQPIFNVKTMTTVINESVSDRRLNMALLSLFAGLALVLATIGIYSVMSYTVTQSTREIGIRMALGARSHQLLKLVLGHGLMLTLIGVAVGLTGAFMLTRLLASLLYGVTATDPFIFTSVPVLLTIVAGFACYLPARRALRMDPVTALRHE